MYDIVLKNGILIDPEKGTRSYGHIGVKNGLIAAVSTEELPGKQVFDVKNRVVCPGFIDIHGHVDLDPYCGELSLRQGITTTVGGNCGLSPLSIDAFFNAQEENGFIINQAEFYGHSISLRQAVGLTDPMQPARADQLACMAYEVERALEEGACGLSLGLAYAPGSSTEEIYQLSRIAARYGRLISIDTRMRTKLDLFSLVEAIDIARQTGARVQVSHLVYQYGTGLMAEALAVIERARREGVDVRFDSGMYTEWATHLGAALFDESYIKENGWDLQQILVVTGPYKGKRLTPGLYRELREAAPDTAVVVLTGVEEEIYLALTHPYAMPSTDIGAYEPGEGHPQIAGSFPRFFRKMVLERCELSIMEAVRKATLLPAETLGFHTKGRLRAGMDADLVVFDLHGIADRADFAAPNAAPDGIEYVFVNGVLSLERGVVVQASSGKAVRCRKPIYDYQI